MSGTPAVELASPAPLIYTASKPARSTWRAMAAFGTPGIIIVPLAINSRSLPDLVRCIRSLLFRTFAPRSAPPSPPSICRHSSLHRVSTQDRQSHAQPFPQVPALRARRTFLQPQNPAAGFLRDRADNQRALLVVVRR